MAYVKILITLERITQIGQFFPQSSVSPPRYSVRGKTSTLANFAKNSHLNNAFSYNEREYRNPNSDHLYFLLFIIVYNRKPGNIDTLVLSRSKLGKDSLSRKSTFKVELAPVIIKTNSG